MGIVHYRLYHLQGEKATLGMKPQPASCSKIETPKKKRVVNGSIHGDITHSPPLNT